MKLLVVLLLCALSALYFWPVQPDSGVATFRSRIFCMFEPNSKVLASKKAELVAYEEALQKLDEGVAKMQSEAGICPITGQPNKVTITEDPRPEIRARIDKLQAEIKSLKNRS